MSVVKYKVLQLVSTTGFAGVERFIIELSKELLKSEFQPVIGIIRNEHNPDDTLKIAAEKVHIQTRVFNCSGRFDLRTLKSIRNYVKQENISLIHSHQYKANIFNLLATINMKCVKMTTCHLYDDINYDFKFKIYTFLDKFALRRFNHIVTTSEQIKSDLQKFRLNGKRVSVVYNGIDLTRFQKSFNRNQIRKALGISNNTKVIGTIGRICTQKNQELIIESATSIIKQKPETIFLIIGDGPLRVALMSKIKRLNLSEKIIFLGQRDDIPELLSVMDIFVLPSLDEGLPLALLEAMAARLPVVVTPVGSIPDVVEDGISGLIINGKKQAFIDAILFLLNNPEKAKLLGEHAYVRVARRFTNQEMGCHYLQIYKDLLKHEFGKQN
ncbi:MAG: glycosyltransferase family 1 protein [Calditrichaeota bacterium]|nr:MAG: glycosyltransferase family 1 protein [Calditrichota bacterium]